MYNDVALWDCVISSHFNKIQIKESNWENLSNSESNMDQKKLKDWNEKNTKYKDKIIILYV